MSAEEAVGAGEWALVLADWRNANANVTVHLRGGVSLGPGKVDRIPGAGLDAAQLIGSTDFRMTKWTFDLNDVMAITAQAAR